MKSQRLTPTHRIRISPGNRKMREIPSVSLPPIETCAPDIPCARQCYVVCNMLRGRYGATIKKSYKANLDFLRADRAGFFSQLRGWVGRHSPEYFRFHVSGDFVDADYLRQCIQIARDNSGVRFLAFSKQFALFPHPRAVPSNFTILASLWPSWGVAPAGYRVAYMQDGTETRAPKSAIRCPGYCDTCGMCWELRRLRRDVILPLH